mgnify:CR=1 FL=1
MKPLVVQFFVPAKQYKTPDYNNIGVSQELFDYSVKSVKQYAKKYDLSYKLVTDQKINWIHPTFERFDLFFNDAWWKNYTHILYLDTDVIVWPRAPNIFNEYWGADSFKPVRDRIALRQGLTLHKNNAKGTCLEKFKSETLRNNRFNAGVFMLTKNSVDKYNICV